MHSEIGSTDQAEQELRLVADDAERVLGHSHPIATSARLALDIWSGDSHAIRSGRFNGADLSGVTLVKADLSGAVFLNTKLYDADLSMIDLSHATLTSADLRRAKLSGARLVGANLTNTNLSDADLSDADLSDAILEGADLTGANMSRSSLIGAKLRDAHIEGARLQGVEWDGETQWPEGDQLPTGAGGPERRARIRTTRPKITSKLRRPWI
jgi:hypothetical protein